MPPKANGYRSIATELGERIRRREFDRQLPSTAELANEYGVALLTMQRAVGVLKDQELVRTIPGTGIIPTRLRRPRSHVLGAVLGTSHGGLNAPLHEALIGGMQRAAQARQEAICLSEGTEADENREVEQVRTLLNTQKVDGIILWPFAQSSRVSAGAAYLREERIPCVLVPEPDARVYADFHTVSNADSGAASEVMQHLLEQGHRAIRFVQTQSGEGAGYQEHRFGQYRRAMREAGLPVLPPLEVGGPDSFKDSVAEISRQLRAVTAVFCVTDKCALNLLEYCLHQGIRVPHNLSVVGYDNTAVAAAMGLTSVEQNFAAIGETAISLLLDEIENRCSAPVHRTVDSEIIYRRSTAEQEERR